VGGRSYAGANQALERLAGDLDGRLLVVPWADAVRANPRLLAGDGVHATPAGYRSRAQLYADAARACRG
jgi:lysophospholipase L1-like esterase